MKNQVTYRWHFAAAYFMIGLNSITGDCDLTVSTSTQAGWQPAAGCQPALLAQLPADVALHLDEAVQQRRARSNRAKGAHSARHAGAHAAQVGVVHDVEHVAAHLERERLVLHTEPEITHQASIQL